MLRKGVLLFRRVLGGLTQEMSDALKEMRGRALPKSGKSDKEGTAQAKLCGGWGRGADLAFKF